MELHGYLLMKFVIIQLRVFRSFPTLTHINFICITENREMFGETTLARVLDRAGVMTKRVA